MRSNLCQLSIVSSWLLCSQNHNFLISIYTRLSLPLSQNLGFLTSSILRSINTSTRSIRFSFWSMYWITKFPFFWQENGERSKPYHPPDSKRSCHNRPTLPLGIIITTVIFVLWSKQLSSSIIHSRSIDPSCIVCSVLRILSQKEHREAQSSSLICYDCLLSSSLVLCYTQSHLVLSSGNFWLWVLTMVYCDR